MSKEKIKLLFFSSDRHPAKRVDVSVLFGEQLAGRGHNIDFVLQSEEPLQIGREVTWNGCTVHVGAMDDGKNRLGRVRKHLMSIWHDFSCAWRFRKKGYDFFQLKDKYISALFLLPICKMSGIKFVYWLSYPFPEESLLKAKSPEASYPIFYTLRGRVFDLIFYRLIARSATFIFVQSAQMKRDLAERGVDEEKMLAVPMGIDDRYLAFEGVGGEQRCNTVLYLGTLARVRKMDFLIRTFFHVLKKRPDAELELVGAGDDELDMEILRRESRELGIDESVHFLGWMPMNEALKHVVTATVCVSPFYPTPILNSTSPTKLVEYMALGKAVVANVHPEQRLVIEQSGSGLCVPYEEEAFADAIVSLLDDSEMRVRMGERGRAYVERYRTYSRIADAVEKKYLDLL